MRSLSEVVLPAGLIEFPLGRLGVLVCYLTPEDLRPILSSSPPPALWQQLASCVNDGLVASDGRVSERANARFHNSVVLLDVPILLI